MRQPENEDEILLLGKTAQKSYQSPSHYVFGPDIPLQSQYEIDSFVTMTCEIHEAEQLKKAMDEAKLRK